MTRVKSDEKNQAHESGWFYFWFSGFIYISSDIGLALIDVNVTAGPRRRYAERENSEFFFFNDLMSVVVFLILKLKSQALLDVAL